jgi:hypothetical protein
LNENSKPSRTNPWQIFQTANNVKQSDQTAGADGNVSTIELIGYNMSIEFFYPDKMETQRKELK